MHYYQHHIGDFIKDTSFLTNEEVGIYMKLIWLYYDTEKPLPNDIFTLSMKAGARESESVLLGILNMFFSMQNDEWHHSRCDKEIAEFHGYIESKSRAGKASAERRMNMKATPVEQVSNKRTTHEQLTTTHKPLPTNHNKNTIAKPEGLADLLWTDFLILRKSKKLPVTQTAFDGIKREAKKANKSLPEVIQICCERGWGGFKAEWLVIESLKTQDKPMQKWDSTLEGVMNKGKELGILPKPGETEGQYRERVRSGHK
jgi:uncharacterized protein YdaU (DUF1376 family)